MTECPACGGVHFGSTTCPFTSNACVICGAATIYACSDCAIDTGGSVHVCSRVECQNAHEATHRKAIDSPAEDAVREDAR